MLSIHIITFPQGFIGALRSNINKTKQRVNSENLHYFGVYTAAMGFTSDACWFLLIKNNKKREAALKNETAGTRNVCFFFLLGLTGPTLIFS